MKALFHLSPLRSLAAGCATLVMLAGPVPALAAPATLPAQASETAAVALEGRLEVVFEDHADRTATTRMFLHTVDGKVHELQFPGKEVPNLRAGTRLRVRGHFASDGQNFYLTSDSNNITTLSAPPLETTGQQKVAVVLVNFSDLATQPFSATDMRTMMGKVDAFYQENAYQLVSIASDVYGWYSAPLASTSCDTAGIKTYAQSAIQATGGDPAAYGRFVYVFPHTSACSWAGLANGKDAWVNGYLDLRVIAHELGHTFGLGHAHSMNCAPTPIGTSCVGWDYGDVADAMGTGDGHFNAFAKESLGWLNRSGTPLAPEVSASGQYTLEPYETVGSGGAKALKLPRMIDPNTGEQVWYYLEYRQLRGFDADIEGMGGNQGHGVTLRSANTSRGAFEIDMSPDSSTWGDSYDMMDGALLPGMSFTDPDAGLTVTVTWADSTGAGVDVQFSGQQADCQHAAPAVVLSGPTANVAAGTSLAYTVAVTNNDSSRCAAGSFDLAAVVPAGWSAALGATRLSIAAGSAASTTLTVASTPTAAAGSYPVSLTASSSTGLSATAGTTYSVAASAGSTATLADSVATDQTSYAPGDVVIATATVTAGGKAVSGATVNFSLLKPDGSTASYATTTTSKGVATYKYRLNKRKDGSGSYRIDALASANGANADASAAFSVQ